MYAYLSKFFHRHIHRFGISLYERTAAGRTRFVEHYAVDSVVFYPHALHVLAAYVQDKVHSRQEFFGSFIMGHGFYYAVICVETRLYQSLSVSCNCGVGYISAFRNKIVDFFKHLLGGSQRVSLIASVKTVQKFFIPVDEGGLSRS